MARSRSRRLRRIARQTAELRSSPERRALETSLLEARSGRDAGVQAARTTGAGLRSAIKQARPSFAKTYDEGADRLQANAGLVAGNIPAAGPAGAILAAAAGEHQAAVDANTNARTATLTDLTQQRVRAREGQTFAVQGVQRQYQQDVGKVLQQLLGLSQEEGAFAAAEFGRLRENALDRDTTRRGQTLSSRDRRASLDETKRHNRATEQNARGKANANGGRGWASVDQHQEAQDAIEDARRWVRRLKKTGLDQDDISRVLSTGRESATIHEEVDDGRGGTKRQPVLNDDGSEKKRAEVPSIAPVWLRAALDEEFMGHASRATTRALHKRRLRVRDLPVTSFETWRRANQRAHPPAGGRPRQGAGGYPYGPGAGQVH